MPGINFKTLSSLDSSLRKAMVRWTAGVVILAAAVFLQYQLSNIPAKIQAAGTEGYPERAVNLGEHEMVIQGPLLQTSSEAKPTDGMPGRAQTAEDDLLFFHDGLRNEIVDAHFHSAALSEASIKLFTRLGLRPPSGLTDIMYATSEASSGRSGEPCRTSVRIHLKAGPQPPAEVYLFRKEEPSYHAYRDLWMRARGAELIVDFLTVAPDPDKPDSAGCEKDLVAGSFEQTLPGSVPIEVAVPDGAEFHFNFAPLREDAPNLVLRDDFRPFEFGNSPLLASGMRIERLTPPGVIINFCPCWLTVWPYRCSERSAPFAFSELEVGRTDLRVKVSGEGFVKLNGRFKTRNLLDWAKNNPMLVLLLGALNTGLLGWLKKSFFVKRESPQYVYDDD